MLYHEPLEPKRMTAEEAFEAGKAGNLTDYDAAGRKAARLWYEAATKNEKLANILGSILCIHKTLDRHFHGPENDRYQIWQDWLLDLDSYFSYAMKHEDSGTYKQIDSIGLTGFQAGWAIQVAAETLREQGFLDEHGFTKYSKYKGSKGLG